MTETRGRKYGPFREALGDNPIAALTFGEIIDEIRAQLTTMLAATEVQRLLRERPA